MSLESLGRHTVQMHDVLDAFARMDLDAKRCVSTVNKKVTRGVRGIVRQLMTYMMEDSRTIPSVLTRVILRALYQQRIGDRCQNICEPSSARGADFRRRRELDKGCNAGGERSRVKFILLVALRLPGLQDRCCRPDSVSAIRHSINA